MDIGRSQAQFPSTLLKNDPSGKGLLELFGYGRSAVWTPIVDDYDLVIEVAIKCQREGGEISWL